MIIDGTDERLLAAIADGLPLVARPYAAVGEALALSEGQVLARLRRLIDNRIITRFGVVVRHRKLGFRANAMVVWDVPAPLLQAAAWTLTRQPFVTLCYARRRQPPEWPYNLYSMIHGRARDTVLGHIEALGQTRELAGLDSQVLFSRRCFKQRGAHYADPAPESVRGAA